MSRRRPRARESCKSRWIEAIERRLLLAATLDLQQLGFTFLPEPEEVGPGAWLIALGPSPDELQLGVSFNASAAVTIRADELRDGGGLGLDLTGEDVTVGIWDDGRVRSTHQEFMTGGSSRVTFGNPAGAFSDHATHVAGTIGAGGADAGARGIANSVAIRSYDYDHDGDELSADAEMINVSNHSYGFLRGWTTAIPWDTYGNIDTWFADRAVFDEEDPYFGKYSGANELDTEFAEWPDASPAQIDDILHDNPNLLSVWAAGNDRIDDFQRILTDPFNPDRAYYATYFSTGMAEPGWYLGTAHE